MDPRQFHQLAVALAERDDPAACRTAISRAYYAVYHVAREALGRVGIAPHEGPTGHRDLQQHLANAGDADLEMVAQRLWDLHSLRLRADYVLAHREVEAQGTARRWVAEANRIIVCIGQCFADEARRARIEAAVQAWREGLSKPG